MEQLKLFSGQVRRHLLTILIANNLVIFVGWWMGQRWFNLDFNSLFISLLIVALIDSILFSLTSTYILTKPIKLVAQAILHISPDEGGVAAPEQSATSLGKDMVSKLCNEIYRIANVAQTVSADNAAAMPDLRTNFIANRLPLPLIVLSKKLDIIFANEAALKYLRYSAEDITGKSVYSALDLSFTTTDTFDTWYSQAKTNSVAADHFWRRVRLKLADQKTPVLFDLAAYYNKDNSSGYEILLTMFDHTHEYSQDEQAMNFVALAVHELRTPLTLLRGYIDALDEELSNQLSSEQADFLKKMEASAQQLSAFVSNILNVSRVDNDQLLFKLSKEDWADIVTAAANDMSLQAQLRGIKLTLQIQPNLPPVGVDRVTVYEVLINLLDNAIKYSDKSKEIIIKSSLTKDGFVETTVQDFGIGVPEAIMTNLFDKFYRSHRNVLRVGGTGLGLYLSKAIISGHGGNIWVRSKEGQGSAFSFTVLPFSRLADEQKNKDNGDIIRSAHGWIKNHSYYRR